MLESLIIIVGNIFTIFVFWKHRNRLKQTSFLLINLAVADLLVGFTEPISLGTFYMPGHFKERNFNSAHNKPNISIAFQIAFSIASVFFLVLISLERGFALIWPLRHRVASRKGYIYSATFAWIAAISAGTSTLLALYDILDFGQWIVAFSCVTVLCLVTICVSYLAIRKRLNCRVPAIDDAHNRQNELQQNARLSTTLFIVITASLLFWIPSIVVYSTYHLYPKCVPLLVVHIFNLFRLANSLVNPIIYSFRIPIFRETFKRAKLCKESKEYTINYTPWNLIEDGKGTSVSRPQALGALNIPGYLKIETSTMLTMKIFWLLFKNIFSFASTSFLALISLERAYSLIWPLRYRVTSIKGYTYSPKFAWITAIRYIGFCILDICIRLCNGFCVVTICVCCLAIRTRLNSRVAPKTQNRPNETQQKAKL